MGNVTFNAKKISYLWGDPLYEGWFTYVLEPNDKQIHQKMFSRGAVALFIYSYAKVDQNILYLGLFFAGVRKIFRKQYSTFDIMVMLIFIGFFFFYLIWEVHPRYILCVIPLFISYLFVDIQNVNITEDSKNLI
ncbi:MAG: hypothetical protein ACRC6X_05940 [Culicoidibacterales bacterium]